MNIILKIKFPLLIVLMALVSSCTVHHIVSIHYLPGDTSPLTTLTPITFLVQIDDHRPSDEQGKLSHSGKVVSIIGGGTTFNIREALKTEIEQSNHKVVFDETAQHDAVVKINLKRMIYSLTDKGVGIIKTIKINAEVSVRKKGDTTQISNFEVTEVQEKESFIASRAADDNMMNEAFNNFIRNIILDPNFTKPFES